jgi:voltage-gated potassium channel
MTNPRTSVRHGNAYEIFILVLTIFSLLLMALAILPLDESTRFLVTTYDNAVCVIFLIDFTYNLRSTRPRRHYFIGQRGWLDLLGSIPTLGFFPYTALFRLARLSRLARIIRMLRGQAGKDLVLDVVQNRGSYATFITILAAGIVLCLSSIAILQFESRAPDANIRTGGDALWWSVVTITTVGYGDFYPVTALGRLTAFFVMIAGVGIIGALASILASVLVTSPADDGQSDAAMQTAMEKDAASDRDVVTELARLSAEISALREKLEAPRT